MIRVTIRQAAQARGIKKPYQLAKATGISQSMANALWSAERLPDLKTLDKICEAWKGCEIGELVRYVRNGAKASRSGRS